MGKKKFIISELGFCRASNIQDEKNFLRGYQWVCKRHKKAASMLPNLRDRHAPLCLRVSGYLFKGDRALILIIGYPFLP